MTLDQITNAADGIRKYRTGEPISDQELLEGIKVLNVVTEFLGQLGPVYILPRNDLINVLDGFRAAVSARRGSKT